MLFYENSNVWIDCMSVFFLSINFDQQRLQLPINVFFLKINVLWISHFQPQKYDNFNT